VPLIQQSISGQWSNMIKSPGRQPERKDIIDETPNKKKIN